MRRGEKGGTYLDVLAVFVACGFPEKGPHDHAIGVEFANDRIAGHGREAGEDDEFVVLAQVAQEVIHARPFRHPPPVFPRPLAVHQQVFQAENERIRSLPRGVRVRQQLLKGRFVVVIQRIGQPRARTIVEETETPA